MSQQPPFDRGPEGGEGDQQQPSQPLPSPQYTQYPQPPMGYGSPQQPYPQQPQWNQPPPPQYSGQPVQYFIPPQQPKKSRTWLWITLAIIGSVVLLSCGLCALVIVTAHNATTRSAVITIGSTTGTTPTTLDTPTTYATIAKVGQTITVQDMSCTLISVHKLSADAYSSPKPGNQYIFVHVKLANNGPNGQDYNPFNFHVKSGSGNITDEDFTTSYTGNNQLNSGKLAAGGRVEGDIVFQVTIGDHKAELTWQPNYFGSSSDYAWNLGL